MPYLPDWMPIPLDCSWSGGVVPDFPAYLLPSYPPHHPYLPTPFCVLPLILPRYPPRYTYATMPSFLPYILHCIACICTVSFFRSFSLPFHLTPHLPAHPLAPHLCPFRFLLPDAQVLPSLPSHFYSSRCHTISSVFVVVRFCVVDFYYSPWQLIGGVFCILYCWLG